MRKVMTISVILALMSVMLLGSCDKGQKSTAKASTDKTATKISAEQSTAKKTTAKTTTNVTTDLIGLTDPGDNQPWIYEPDDDTQNESETPETEEEIIDFKGQTIVVSEWNDTFIPKSGISEAQDIAYKCFYDTMAKYNCNVEWKEFLYPNYHNEFVNAMMAGVKFADISLLMTTFAIPNYVNQGFLIPVEEYIDYSKGIYDREALRWKGEVYFMQAKNNQFAYCTIYNPRLLDNAGLKDIWSLVKEKRWNNTALRDYAIELTRDFNGDGVLDQWGIGANLLYPVLTYANGVNTLTMVDGKLVSGLHQQASMHALQFIYDLFFYKVCDYSANVKNNFYNGLIGIWPAGVSDCTLATKAGVTDIAFAPPPMGPDVVDYQVFSYGGYGWSVPVNTEYDTKEILTIFGEAMFSIYDPESPYYMSTRDQYISLHSANTMKNTQMVADMYDYAQMVPDKVYDLSGGIPGFAAKFLYPNILNPVTRGQKSPGTVLAETETSMQQFIDAAVK